MRPNLHWTSFIGLLPEIISKSETCKNVYGPIKKKRKKICHERDVVFSHDFTARKTALFSTDDTVQRKIKSRNRNRKNANYF